MNQISLGDDKALSYYARFIIVSYVLLGFFEKIHTIVDTILILDGLLTFFGMIFVFIWFFDKRRFPCNKGSVSLLIFTFFILFSSLVGRSSMARFSVSGFAIVETWALILAIVEVKRDIHDIFLYLSLFAVLFAFVYSIFSLIEGIENSEVRVSGLSDQSNSLGVMASISIILCMVNIRKWRKIAATIVWNVIDVSLIPFFLFTLWKSDSRTSMLAIVLASLFIVITSLVFLRKQSSAFWALIPSLVVVVAALVFLITGVRSLKSYTLDTFSSGRTIIWRETFDSMGLKEYLLGFSGNDKDLMEKLVENGASSVTLSMQGEKHLAHNMFLGIFFEYGVFAAITFIFGWIWTMKKGIGYLSKKKKWGSREVFASLSLLSFFLIHSIAESSIYFIGGAEQLLFIFSIAVLYAVTVAKRKSVNE